VPLCSVNIAQGKLRYFLFRFAVPNNSMSTRRLEFKINLSIGWVEFECIVSHIYIAIFQRTYLRESTKRRRYGSLAGGSFSTNATSRLFGVVIFPWLIVYAGAIFKLHLNSTFSLLHRLMARRSMM